MGGFLSSPRVEFDEEAGASGVLAGAARLPVPPATAVTYRNAVAQVEAGKTARPSSTPVYITPAVYYGNCNVVMFDGDTGLAAVNSAVDSLRKNAPAMCNLAASINGLRATNATKKKKLFSEDDEVIVAIDLKSFAGIHATGCVVGIFKQDPHTSNEAAVTRTLYLFETKTLRDANEIESIVEDMQDVLKTVARRKSSMTPPQPATDAAARRLSAVSAPGATNDADEESFGFLEDEE